jgi:hypothetical protein
MMRVCGIPWHGPARSVARIIPCARENQTPQNPQNPQTAGQRTFEVAGFRFRVNLLNPANPAALRGLRGMRVIVAGFETPA